MMERKESSFCLLFVLYVASAHLIWGGQAAVIEARPNPCVEYSTCTHPFTIPLTRVITAFYSFNFFRLANGVFLSAVCLDLNQLAGCDGPLRQCEGSGWSQGTHAHNSDARLAQWACRNQAQFEAHRECWNDPFLAEMSSCTGLEQLLQPRQCLVDKIDGLDNCTLEAREFFRDLLSAAHST